MVMDMYCETCKMPPGFRIMFSSWLKQNYPSILSAQFLDYVEKHNFNILDQNELAANLYYMKNNIWKNNQELFQYVKLLDLIQMQLTGSIIFFNADIGPGLRIGHPNGIVIGKAEIGRELYIHQNCTIASGAKIGEHVTMYAGVVVLEVKVGDWSMIGANAVVTHDVEHHSLVMGVPARKVK